MRKLPLVLLFIISCTTPEKKPPLVLEEVSLGVSKVNDYPKYLSEWGLFKHPMNELKPTSTGIFPYDINAPLFTDYAHKARFIKLPEGKKIDYHSGEVLSFPKETILIKNFYYPSDFKAPEKERRVLETRLLIHEADGWNAIVYQWNKDQSDAERLLLGNDVPITWRDEKGILQKVNYSIPSQPQCKSCHDLNGKLTPIGPSARQLNKGNQLIAWHEKGLLEIKTDQSIQKLTNYTDETQPLDLRARAWLEANCGHCHRREGPAKNSGLYLLASQTDPYRLGVNKPPIAAGKGSGGLKYSIVPGKAEQSILIHRMASMEPGEMMPELGRSMPHKEGIDLISDWIAQMR